MAILEGSLVLKGQKLVRLDIRGSGQTGLGITTKAGIGQRVFAEIKGFRKELGTG